jgi:hypothetical protein
VFVACAVRDRAAVQAALRALFALGVAPSAVGLGAQPSGADDISALAAEFGVRADIDPLDPLAGAPGLASAASAAEGINLGGVVGGLMGAVVGLVVAYMPNFTLVETDPHYRVLAAVLLCFVLGALAGATLGSGLSPQRSTHAAYRIADEIEHHGIALVVVADAATADGIVACLTESGGVDTIRIPASVD